MRKIMAGMFMTLDGVIEAPEQWNPPYYNEEMTEAVQAQMAQCDTHLYGRKSYELFQGVFTGPNSEHIPHASLMTDAPKVVVSTTLQKLDWGPTTVIRDNVVEEITKLKELPGKHISVGASATLVGFLLENELLDELGIHLHPVVIGTGQRLFEDGDGPRTLRLTESKQFANGVVSLRYAKAD
jgi:dihydrofolate reductase